MGPPSKWASTTLTKDGDQAGENQLSEMQSLSLVDRAKSEANVLGKAECGPRLTCRLIGTRWVSQSDHTNEQDGGPGPRVAIEY